MARTRQRTFGELLRQLRKARGLTQGALAERAGLSVRSLNGLERGEQRPRDGTVELLAEALGLPPDERTALHAAVAVRAGEWRRGNGLPLYPLPFVGREQEITDVWRLVEQRQILTLTGAGGVGKTRLAVEAARRHVPLMRDGVWFAELAPLADPSLVPQAAAAALGVDLEGAAGHTSALVDALRPLRLLLVLDNCEHLADACAELVDAVARDCPHVRVVATSREPLGCRGEAVWPVPPFGAPPAAEAAVLSAGELLNYDAARLFVDRATASLPTFALTERNAWAVADICRRLDGLPLALELAAARVRGLAVELIATRLDDRFRLLTSGGRTASRQQLSLRTAVDWSYELLHPLERALFDRLSVFADGFTLSGAEAVCANGLEVTGSSVGGRSDDATPPIAAADTLDLLLRLVDKSLVQRGDAALAGDEAHTGYGLAAGEERYRLLETLREYGHERLVASGQADEVHRRHLFHRLRCIELAAQGPDAARPEQLRQVEGERENLRTALRWARDRGDAESDRHVRETLSLLGRHLTEPATRQAATPLVFELRRLGVPAFAEFERRLLEKHDQEALGVGADLCWFIGDHAMEATLRRRRLELLEVAGDVRAAARGRVRYARLLVLQNHPQEGIALLDEVVRTAAELGDDELLLDAFLEQGHAYDHLADCPSGRRAYASALELLTRLRPSLSRETYQEMRLVALRGSGNTAHNADDNATGVANHAEALAIAQEYGHHHEEAMQWVNFADGQWGTGEYGASLKTYRKALQISTASCYTLARGLASLGYGIVLWSVGRLPEAARSLEDGLEIAREVGNAWWIAYGLTYLGNVRASQGDLDGARRLSREAVASAQAGGVGYPLALSRMHALWQDEVAVPGDPEHASRIEEALWGTQRLGLLGLEVYLCWVRLLHRVADPTISDAVLAGELAEGVQVYRARAPLKGCWELIGQQLLRAGTERRPGIAHSDLKALVDEVIGSKAATLPPEQRPAYRDSRHPWKGSR